MNQISNFNINWDVPKHIKFFVSTNETGKSKGLYKSGNFSNTVGDDKQSVRENINILKKQLNISNIAFMNQTHSSQIKAINYFKSIKKCDAIYTTRRHIACAVLTADCIPLLVTDQAGSFVGCIHAGWRGLYKGIIQKYFMQLKSQNFRDFKVLLGPCISPCHYEVDSDLLQKFSSYKNSFKLKNNGKYMMDIISLTQNILNKIGVYDVTITRSCTYNDKRFYSYRRNKVTGRFISLIWFKNDN